MSAVSPAGCCQLMWAPHSSRICTVSGKPWKKNDKLSSAHLYFTKRMSSSAENTRGVTSRKIASKETTTNHLTVIPCLALSTVILYHTAVRLLKMKNQNHIGFKPRHNHLKAPRPSRMEVGGWKFEWKADRWDENKRTTRKILGTWTRADNKFYPKREEEEQTTRHNTAVGGAPFLHCTIPTRQTFLHRPVLQHAWVLSFRFFSDLYLHQLLFSIEASRCHPCHKSRPTWVVSSLMQCRWYPDWTQAQQEHASPAWCRRLESLVSRRLKETSIKILLDELNRGFWVLTYSAYNIQVRHL